MPKAREKEELENFQGSVKKFREQKQRIHREKVEMIHDCTFME